ncbi:MAG: autotransporter-associated beta strand repeat-containing protein, partial [Verrucomicrobia bacterium]|nr:autotransporter-associated beta strand repeat-containing protein [Verrucomicrobiota bacterium]
MESALGSDFGLSKIPGVDNAGLFAMLTTSAGKRSFNFADSGAGNSRGPQLFWWARRYLRPEYAYYQRTNAAPEPLDTLLFDPRGGDPVQEQIQPDFYFRGPTGTTIHLPQEVGVFRSGWNDTRETWLAFKGGEMGAPHGDLDAGSFVIEALGKRWAQDLGSDDYALPGYFSDNPAPGVDRWDYYRLRAEGNNCLVINPGSGPDTKLDQVATTLMFQSQTNGGRSLAVLDLTPVETNVTRAWRGFQLLNARKDVLVQDEIVAATNATAWWFMHVQTNTTDVAIDPDGSAVMLTQGAERLWLKILTTNGTFTLSNASPLPTSPNPPGQNANSNYAKLAIKLTGVTNTTLAVLMKPLATNQPLPLVLPTVVPLAQWLISPDDAPLALDGYFTTPENIFLDVDLTTLATDLVTPGSNLIFGVSGATNGSVALLADGHTARFTPATNYYGPAQFIYTVTNAATNAASAGVVVTVLPATWYWDTSTTAGLQAASGTWDGANSNWSSASAGSSPLLAWPPQGNDAMFVGAGGSYTVTIGATQKVNQISTTNGTWTFSGGALNHASGPLIITADADTTLNSPLVADTDFAKLGTNRLTLGAPVTFSGDVTVPTGTLRLATNGALPPNVDARIGSTNGTVGNLEVNASQTLASLNFQALTTLTNTVSIPAGNTLTISNAAPGIAFGVGNYGSTIGSITATTRVAFVSGGSLAIAATNGTFSIEPSGTNNAGTALAVLDLSKLSNFSASVGSFSGSVVAGKPNNVSGQFTLTLATNNTITATNVVLAASGNGSGTVTISLGASNRINANNLAVAGGRYTATMSFQTGASSNLTLRGASGGTSRANVFAGDQINFSGVGGGGGGSSTSTGTLNFGAATVDARINQLTLGIGASVASQTYGTGIGTFTFGGSNSLVDVNQVYLGYATLNSTVGTTFNSPTHTGTLNMNGGALTVNSNFFLGYSADDNLGNTQKVAGVFNLSGGVATVASNIFLGYATNTVGTVTGNLNLTNGTLIVGGDILSSGVTATGAVNLVGATLNLNGGNIGSAAKPISLVTSNGTLQNLGELNDGTTPLTKIGAGALTIAGTNAFTGGTILSAGTLRLTGNLGSGVTATNGVFSGNGAITGSLVLGAPVSFQPQINGTNAG